MAEAAAVVIVNFNSGEYLAGCIDALAPSRQNGLVADILVVENASPLDQSTHLEAARARGARVLQLDHNTGYAGGCNRGLHGTTAANVFFLNADVVAGRGALPTLIQHLHDCPRTGFAEPRIFVDPARQWRQPEFVVPTLRGLAAATLANRSRSFAERCRRRELRRQVASWTAASPRSCSALSGAFLATRRERILRIDGFDERYPLAYEDTDAFRRMRAAGMTLAMVPAAEALHYAHRSRVTVLAESIAKDRLGRRLYLRRHHGHAGLLLDRVREWSSGRGAGSSATNGTVVVAPSAGPPTLQLTGAPAPFVLQLAYDRSFEVAAGCLGDGATFTFAPDAWSALLPTTVHVRAFALADLRPRGAWTLHRGDPARAATAT